MNNLTQQLLKKKESPELIKSENTELQISQRKIKQLKIQSKNSPKQFSALKEKPQLMQSKKRQANTQLVQGNNQNNVCAKQQNKEQQSGFLKKISIINNPDNIKKSQQKFEQKKQMEMNPFMRNPFNQETKRPEYNIFQKTKNTINLFQTSSTNINIFNQQKKQKDEIPVLKVPSINLFLHQQVNREEQESEQQYLDQPEAEIDKKKSTGIYEYKKQFDKLFEVKIQKFKAQSAHMLTEVNLSIQKIINANNIYIIIRDEATKIIKFQGLIFANKLNIQKFMDKQQNIIMNVWNIIKLKQQNSDEQKNILNKQVIKIKFKSVSDCEQFKKAIKEIEKSKEQQKQVKTQI